MLKRKIADIEVSAIGFGCWAIGGPFKRTGGGPMGWGDVDDDASIRAIHCAIDLGVNLFDTANNYGAGRSEKVLGRAIKDRRDSVVIATKFGSLFSERTGFHIDDITDFDIIVDEHFIRNAIEGSLRRLQTDYIDVYQFHWGNYPAEDAVIVREVLEKLVAEGKIRTYGWSTDDRTRARVFAEGDNCGAIQHDLSIFSDAPDMLALCEENELASINKKPLAGGFLTGKFTKDTVFPENDLRSGIDMNHPHYADRLQKLDAIRDILQSDGRSMAQGALAWNLARSPHTIPIPGFKTEKQVRENAGVLQYGPLSEDAMQEIERRLSQSVV